MATAAVGEHFERLWADDTPGLSVIPLHDAFRTGLMTARDDPQTVGAAPGADARPPSFDLTGATAPVPPGLLRRPTRFELRDDQRAAVEGWFANRGVGVYAMATGTGKTFTALCTAEELYRRAAEVADLASNRGLARRKLSPVLQRLNLSHLEEIGYVRER